MIQESRQDPKNKDRHGTSGVGTEIEAMEKIGMRRGLFLGFLFFVSTCVSAKEPEEIWRDLGKLRG
jgi:hypothetical protein